MNLFTRFIVAVYSKSLNLYPRRFRDEFVDEMRVVFRDSINDALKDRALQLAILCLRELCELPFNVLREFWHEIQGKELVMLHENNLNTPATTRQIIIGAFPFFLFSLILILSEVPASPYINAIVVIMFVVLLILPVIGFGIGWVKHFPRWSYPYAGTALVLSAYFQNVSTPGLNFLGIPIFGRELWGWRAWVPLGTAFIIALIISRSLKPFISFFINLWNDWSILSYFMVSAVPLLVMFAFDEINRTYSLYFMVPFAVVLMGMVIFYLRAQNAWHRALILTVGVITIIFPAVIGMISYWSPRNGIFLSGIRTTWTRAITITLIMLIPAWLEFTRRFVGRLRAA